MGWLEKTDRIDAGLIAWYAEVKRIAACPPPSEAQERLTALVGRLRQLTELKVMQLNQRRLQTDPTVLASIDAVIALVRGQIRQFEREIARLIAADKLWYRLDQTFRSIKGVADRTVARLMADLPEIGLISNKAIAKLVGLAPIAKDSGKLNGKRRVRGGRASVRSILFLIAEIVRRYGSRLCRFPPQVDPSRESQKGRSHRPRSQTPRSPQRKGARCTPTARPRRLTNQTVAHPFARAIASAMNCRASAASPQPMILAHLPGSKSL